MHNSLFSRVIAYAHAYHDLYGEWPRLIHVPFREWAGERMDSVNVHDMPKQLTISAGEPLTPNYSIVRIMVEPV